MLQILVSSASVSMACGVVAVAVVSGIIVVGEEGGRYDDGW